MTVDRAALAEAIEWSNREIDNFTDRPVHNTEAARKTRLLIAAAQAHLDTLPRVKQIKTWHVECVVRTGMGDAAIYTPLVSVCASSAIRDRILAERTGCPLFSCIRVTGPHAHEVPSP